MNMASTHPKVALYDMDRTITVRGTYTPFLFHMVFKCAPWRIVFLPILPLGFLAYGLKLINRAQLKTFNQYFLLGGSPKLKSLEAEIESYADHVLLTNCHIKAVEQVESDRKNDRILVLVTASYELYVDSIARRLGFDHVIGTQLDIDQAGAVRPRIIGENCYGDAKIGRIEALFDQQGWQRTDAHVRAYSDHVSDQPMLEWADEAVATTPSPALRQLAEKRGWKIVDWV